jgi:pSer/pThr/pTyr-binding forkhead associated (FHA) protein
MTTTAKLALYFLAPGASNSPRILEADTPPETGYWLVGRSAAVCQIVFKDRHTSKIHARLTARPATGSNADDPDWAWEVTDLGSTNSTFVDGYRIPPNRPFPITEQCRIDFGSTLSSVRASHDIDDTSSTPYPEEPTTSGVTPTTTATPSGMTWPDIAAIILTGPPGMPAALWWVLLSIGGLLAVWILK